MREKVVWLFNRSKLVFDILLDLIKCGYKINAFISEKRNLCSSVLILILTGINAIFVPMVDYNTGFVVNLYKEALASAKAKSDEANFQQTFFWTQTIVLKGLSPTDERDRAIQSLSIRHENAVKDSSINTNFTAPRFEAEKAVKLVKYGSGVIIASIAFATSATVLEKNSLIYASFLTGCIGLGTVWYANNLYNKLFDKFIYELR